MRSDSGEIFSRAARLAKWKSLYRGVPALLLPAARRHSAVATTPHAYKMAASYLLESNAKGCRRRVAPLRRLPAVP
jgi:hypothetical protein